MELTEGMVAAAAPLACRAACASARAAARVVKLISGVYVLTGVVTRQPVVALTIDDGPHPDTTPGVLDVLARHHSHGTFMIIGERGLAHPGLVEDIAAAGHELGNHLMRDEPSVRLGRHLFGQQLDEVDAIIEREAPVRWYRPGSGWFDVGMLHEGAARGKECALGAPLLVRERYPDPGRTGRRLAALCHPGAVVVVHEGTSERAGVVTVIEALLQAMNRRGLRAVTLSALVTAEGQ